MVVWLTKNKLYVILYVNHWSVTLAYPFLTAQDYIGSASGEQSPVWGGGRGRLSRLLTLPEEDAATGLEASLPASPASSSPLRSLNHVAWLENPINLLNPTCTSSSDDGSTCVSTGESGRSCISTTKSQTILPHNLSDAYFSNNCPNSNNYSPKNAENLKNEFSEQKSSNGLCLMSQSEISKASTPNSTSSSPNRTCFHY